MLVAFPALLIAQDEERVALKRPRETEKGYSEFSLGYTSTMLDENLRYITDRTLSNGVFIQLRTFSSPSHKPSVAFFRFRAAYDTWGEQKMLGFFRDEMAEVKRLMLTCGIKGYGFGDNLFSGGYGGLEFGVCRLDAKTTYPSMSKIKFTNTLMRFVVGWDIWRFTIEGSHEVAFNTRKFRPEDKDLDPLATENWQNKWGKGGGGGGTGFSIGYRF